MRPFGLIRPAALAQTASYHDALGISPRGFAKKPADHPREFASEVFDRCLDQASSFGVAIQQ
jgi:hypothetical protein